MASNRKTLSGPATALLVFFFCSPLVGADSDLRDRERSDLRIPRIDSVELHIDGQLDEAAWSEALSVRLETEWFPGDGVEPPVETEVLLFYDSDRLYVGFRCFDPDPEAIRSHLIDRDQIAGLLQDDHVSLLLDPFGDQRSAFLFLVNPKGVQAEAIYNQIEESEDFSWDVIWDSAGRESADGWRAEIAIPFSQLRFPRTEGEQAWGFDLGRSYPRDRRHSISLSPRHRDERCVLCQIPTVSGFEGIEPGLNLQLAPTLVATRVDSAPAVGEPLESGDEDAELGLDVRWGITPNLTLSAAVNPDFSQVEADVRQLDVNERFALFFPEKRPFFLEGSDYFSSQILAVFTRNVVDPEWGLRLTGKVGKNAVGAFVASDEVNTFLLPEAQRTRAVTLEGGVDHAVARYRRDIGESSTLGLIYTGREGDDYENHVAGVDGFLRFGTGHAVSFQVLGSDTTDPDDLSAFLGREPGSFDDYAAEVFYSYSDREWSSNLGYRSYGEDFRADLGFVDRVDIETWRAQTRRTFWAEEGSATTFWRLGSTVLTTDDQSGELIDRRLSLDASWAGRRQSEVQAIASVRDLRAGSTLFENLVSGVVYGEIQPHGGVSLQLEVEAGDDVDFEGGREGESLRIQPQADFRIGDHIDLQLDYQTRRLDIDQGKLFTADLAQMRLVYQWNVRTFVRALVQYVDIDFDQDLYAPADRPDDVEELLSELLFSYRLGPQTVLFLGYSDDQLGLSGQSLEDANRGFFFKVGYVFGF